MDAGFGFATSSKTDVQIDQLPQSWQKTVPVFLPTRELLTIYPGFISMYENHYLEFEESWRDTCLLLGAPALKGPREKKTASLLQPLEEAMGGKIVLDNTGRFYLAIPGQGNMEISLVAEGFSLILLDEELEQSDRFMDAGEVNGRVADTLENRLEMNWTVKGI